MKFWNMSKIPLMLWACRIFAFVWTYMIHDYLSLLPLLWIFHSTVFDSETLFAKITLFGYLPILILQVVYYYLLNSPNVFSAYA